MIVWNHFCYIQNYYTYSIVLLSHYAPSLPYFNYTVGIGGELWSTGLLLYLIGKIDIE